MICATARMLFWMVSPLLALSWAADALGMNPDRKVQAASEVLKEMLNAPAKGIPLSMLEEAEGVVIIPEVIKVGFVIGVQRGEGVALIRDQNRVWQLPKFVTITAGSVGWQVGAESSDFVLVFKTRKGVDGLMSGKFTIGADANAAVGPVGRQIGAATDAKLRRRDLHVLSQSRIVCGRFVGGFFARYRSSRRDGVLRQLSRATGGESARVCVAAFIVADFDF